MPDDIEHLKTNPLDFGDPHPSESSPYTGFGMPSEPLEAYGGEDEAPEQDLDAETIKQQVVDVLRQVYDPEIPVNIYDLGLIYDIAVDDQKVVEVQMTLTAPGCPVADHIVREVADKSGGLPGVRRSHVRLVWDPPWTMDRMSEEARLELGLM